jgi:hypothetical protein
MGGKQKSGAGFRRTIASASVMIGTEVRLLTLFRPTQDADGIPPQQFFPVMLRELGAGSTSGSLLPGDP